MEESSVSQVPISLIKSHKGVVSSTVAGWIKHFSTHSARSASNSNEERSWVLVTEILKRVS